MVLTTEKKKSAAYGAADAFAELPNLVHPRQIDENIKEEVWNYYFPID